MNHDGPESRKKRELNKSMVRIRNINEKGNKDWCVFERAWGDCMNGVPWAGEGAATYLTKWYCSVEDIFKEITQYVDMGNVSKTNEHWHKSLIESMCVENEYRKPLFSTNEYSMLIEVMSFRHVNRGTYGNEFDIKKMSKAVNSALLIKPRIDAVVNDLCSDLKDE